MRAPPPVNHCFSGFGGAHLPRPAALTFGGCGCAVTAQLCLLQQKLMSSKQDRHARKSPPLVLLGVHGDIYLPRPALLALAQFAFKQ